MAEPLIISTFEKLLNDTFELGEEGAPSLVLIEVKDLGERKVPRRDVDAGDIPVEEDHAFSLLFRGPGDAVLPQQIYTFRHDAIGEKGIFITAVGRDETGVQYEAIFN